MPAARGNRAHPTVPPGRRRTRRGASSISIGHIVTRVDPVELTSRLEDVLPLVMDSPVKAVAVSDAGRITGLLRLEEIHHLLTESA